LTATLGVSPVDVQPAGDEESVSEYVARCNARAVARGAQEIFHEVAIDADAHVFIAVTPEAMRALVEGGYVEVDDE
jgi:hypothetical protein